MARSKRSFLKWLWRGVAAVTALLFGGVLAAAGNLLAVTSDPRVQAFCSEHGFGWCAPQPPIGPSPDERVGGAHTISHPTEPISPPPRVAVRMTGTTQADRYWAGQLNSGLSEALQDLAGSSSGYRLVGTVSDVTVLAPGKVQFQLSWQIENGNMSTNCGSFSVPFPANMPRRAVSLASGPLGNALRNSILSKGVQCS